MTRITSIVLSLFFLISCNTEDQKNIEEQAPVIQTEDKENEEIIDELFHSIPPPIELSSLLKSSGFLYDISYLNPIENEQGYETNHKKAINLGVYGTDIAYIHIYDQPQDALKYLSVIKQIADDINIANLFDYQTFQDLLKEENSYDSLINMTTHNFEKINTELREQGREHISAMIVTGGWVEGFYILNKLYQDSSNVNLNEKIAEQKFTLSQILLLLSHFDEQPYLTEIATKLEDIQHILEKAKLVALSDDQENKRWHLSEEYCDKVYVLTNELRAFIIN